MAYLRQVRLRRAHQQLLESDATAETVAAVAKRRGFTNPRRPVWGITGKRTTPVDPRHRLGLGPARETSQSIPVGVASLSDLTTRPDLGEDPVGR
jgi:hypothetical protein